MFWLARYEAEYLSQFDYAGTIADFVVSVLCSGGSAPAVMSDQNAASWGYYDLVTGDWQRKM